MRSKKWVWFVAAVLLGMFLYWWGRGDQQEAAHRGDKSLLRDRTWVDSKPQKYTDYVQGLIVIGHMPIGYFIKASSFDLHVERFSYTGKDGKLRVHFPQSGKDAEIGYKVSACKDLPPFDLCLDLSDNPWGGPTRYYGMKERHHEEKHLGTLRRRMLSELPQ